MMRVAWIVTTLATAACCDKPAVVEVAQPGVPQVVVLQPCQTLGDAPPKQAATPTPKVYQWTAPSQWDACKDGSFSLSATPAPAGYALIGEGEIASVTGSALTLRKGANPAAKTTLSVCALEDAAAGLCYIRNIGKITVVRPKPDCTVAKGE